MDDLEKAKLGASTLAGFMNQFGSAVHANILLEELFRGIYYDEALLVFGKQKQTGHQNHNSPPIEDSPASLPTEGTDSVGTPPELGENDRPDHS